MLSTNQKFTDYNFRINCKRKKLYFCEFLEWVEKLYLCPSKKPDNG